LSRERCIVRLADGSTLRARPQGVVGRGEHVTAWVRPEHIELGEAAAGANVLHGVVDEVSYQGDHVRVRIALPGDAHVVAKCARTRASQLHRGNAAVVRFSTEHCTAFGRQPAAGALL
jgi:putative spermidine/putrescine transport system ATP-binding protein